MTKKYLIFLLTLTVSSSAFGQWSQGIMKPIDVYFTECVPAELSEEKWARQLNYSESKLNSSTLRCNKVIPTQSHNNKNYSFFDHQYDQALNTNPVFITLQQFNPGIQKVLDTESVSKFCSKIWNNFLDLCKRDLAGVENIVQNYTPITPEVIFNQDNTLEIIFREGYASYNIETIENIVFRQSRDFEYDEILETLKNKKIYGTHFIAPQLYRDAQNQGEAYSIFSEKYHLNIGLSHDNIASVYMIDRSTFHFNPALLIQSAITFTEAAMSMLLLSKALSSTHGPQTISQVNTYNYANSQSAYQFDHGWPQWWPQALPQAAFRNFEDTVFDIIQKAFSGDPNSRDVLRELALDCLEGRNTYSLEICQIIYNAMDFKGLFNIREDNSSLIVQNYVYQKSGLELAVRDGQSTRFLAYTNAQGHLLVYLFRPVQPYFKQHIEMHNELKHFLEGYEFEAAGYIDILDYSAEYDSTTMQSNVGYDRPLNLTEQQQLLEKISKLFKSYYQSAGF